MRSLLRVEFDDAIYHVFSRGVARLPTFVDEVDYRHFLERISAIVDQGGLVVYAWCLMANHFHLLVRTPRAGLSKWIGKVIGPYARWFNNRHDRTGYLWQGRYNAILVEDGSYLVDCSRYIHLNPCRTSRLDGFTAPKAYRWSSYQRYISGRGEGDFVDVDYVFSVFGGARGPRQMGAYKKYVESGIGQNDKRPQEGSGRGPVFGSDAFVKAVGRRVATQAKGDLVRQPQARAMVMVTEPSPEDICCLVDIRFSTISFRDRRRIKAYLMKKCSRVSDRAIAVNLDLAPSTVCRFLRRIERDGVENSSLWRKVVEMEGKIKEL